MKKPAKKPKPSVAINILNTTKHQLHAETSAVMEGKHLVEIRVVISEPKAEEPR
jgi:hypothetical protein